MLLIAAAVFGAFAGAGVGTVVAGLTGAVIGGVGGAIASVAHMVILMRQAAAGAPSRAGAGGTGRTPAVLTWSIVLAALFCGLVAGIFFAFSSAVMRSLELQPGMAGMMTMQTINVVVFNPWFGSAFSATPAFCVMAMNAALVYRRDPAATYALAGGALFLIGTLYVTVLCNVPRNDALAAVSSTSPDAASVWSAYLREWTAWNTVRTVAPFAAAALLTVGLTRSGILSRHDDANRAGEGRNRGGTVSGRAGSAEAIDEHRRRRG
jgi:uncharacterized membrane protein